MTEIRKLRVALCATSVALATILSPPARASSTKATNSTCEMNNARSTVESCKLAIQDYEQTLQILRAQKLTSAAYKTLDFQTKKRLFDAKEALKYLLNHPNRSSQSEVKTGSRYIWPSTFATTVNSTNWSGLLSAGNYTSSSVFQNIFFVSGTFTVPTMRAPANHACPNSSVMYSTAVWLGLGGLNESGVLGDSVLYQAGEVFNLDCGGHRSAKVWFEDYHDDGKGGTAQNANYLKGYPVDENDAIVITVGYPSPLDGNGRPQSQAVMTYEIHDTQQGWTATGMYTDPEGLYPTGTAEAIVERTCIPGNGGCQPAPPYLPMDAPTSGNIYFSSLYYSANALDMQTNNNPINSALLPGQCLNSQENAMIDCADPETFFLTANACEKATATASDGLDGYVTYIPIGIPNQPTTPPMIWCS